jgi:hypothetical protein
MRPRPASGSVVASLLSLVAVASAQELSFQRFDGGGRRATDCYQVLDVGGVTGSRRAVAARCTDGDPTCDADGEANGSCMLRVRFCFEDSTATRCRPDTVSAAQLTVVPGLEALNASVEAVAALMPLATTDVCTDVTDVVVPRRARGPGRLVVRASATTATKRVDRDRLALVCRPGAPPATFATIERTIFAPSCTSASCHGASHTGGLGLTRGEAFGSLVGVTPSNPGARAAGKLRIAPGDTTRSFLLDKLSGNLTADEGSPMPFVGDRLPARSIDLVRRWIAAGAPATAPF